jgi:hypothetical protein
MASYDIKYCKGVQDHCDSGRSWVSYAGKIRVTLPTMLKWAEDNPEFAEALEIAKLLTLCYWEGEAIDASEDGNAQALQMAKYMLDQNSGYYDRAYKRNLSTISPSDLNRKAIGNYNETDRNRDVLAEMMGDGT